jgi:short-subunit dehydrogenase
MPTALVTGSTSGIGHAFARHLARAGYTLVTVARDTERLATDSELFRSAGAPDVEVLPADLTDPAQRDAVAARLRDASRPVDLLVNNAGLTLNGGFLDVTDRDLQYQLDINVTAVLLLTHAAVPGMVDRGHGGVINVASIAGFVPGRSSTYGASKAWVLQFTEGLVVALKDTGVRVQALCPGFVRTEFHRRAGIEMAHVPGMLYVDVDHLVSSSLAALRENRPVVIPGGLYKTVGLAAKVFPRSVLRAAANRIDRKPRS